MSAGPAPSATPVPGWVRIVAAFVGAVTGLLVGSLAAGITYIVFEGCFGSCEPPASTVFGALMLGVMSLIGAVVAVLARTAATGAWRPWRRAALIGALAALLWLVVYGQLR